MTGQDRRLAQSASKLPNRVISGSNKKNKIGKVIEKLRLRETEVTGKTENVIWTMSRPQRVGGRGRRKKERERVTIVTIYYGVGFSKLTLHPWTPTFLSPSRYYFYYPP